MTMPGRKTLRGDPRIKTTTEKRKRMEEKEKKRNKQAPKIPEWKL
jgi:hypothetical protein